MEGDVCSHTGDLISSPQAQLQLCVGGKLSTLLLLGVKSIVYSMRKRRVRG